jgi:hypothetical protein
MGELPLGTTATDLALTITEMLRKHGVVGKFVEFYGPGVVSATNGEPRNYRKYVTGIRFNIVRSSQLMKRHFATYVFTGRSAESGCA